MSACQEAKLRKPWRDEGQKPGAAHARVVSKDVRSPSLPSSPLYRPDAAPRSGRLGGWGPVLRSLTLGCQPRGAEACAAGLLLPRAARGDRQGARGSPARSAPCAPPARRYVREQGEARGREV